ncbi:MAG: hypothetical protein M1827_004482 [Pycnora praestabilis]|nr:MAG: hypothetical protein M1827_004482 [Pycnora praestabilis]
MSGRGTHQEYKHTVIVVSQAISSTIPFLTPVIEDLIDRAPTGVETVSDRSGTISKRERQDPRPGPDPYVSDWALKTRRKLAGDGGREIGDAGEESKRGGTDARGSGSFSKAEPERDLGRGQGLDESLSEGTRSGAADDFYDQQQSSTKDLCSISTSQLHTPSISQTTSSTLHAQPLFTQELIASD